MNKASIILSDICWTLYYSNTTFDFLDYTIQDPRYISLRKRYRQPLYRKLNILWYRLTGIDLHRRKAVGFLKGRTKKELLEQAEHFYQEYLIPRQTEEVHKAIGNSPIVLVSGTLDIIAQAIAHHIKVSEIHASRLLFDEKGICKGELDDFLLCKSDVLQQYHHFTIFTDNLTDLPLVRAADKAFIVEYGNQERWQRALADSKNSSQITFIHATTARY